MGECSQCGQRGEAGCQLTAFVLQLAELAADLAEADFQLLLLRLQRGDLGMVAPSKHVAAPVVEAVAVVLFVPLTW